MPRSGAKPASRARSGERHVRRRHGRRYALGIGVVLSALVLLAVSVYMFPRVDPMPERTDVIYVIGPLTDERLEYARESVDAGIADRMVLSVPDEALVPGNDLGKYRACNVAGGDVVCISPQPFTTQGEASAFAELARDAGWDEVVVITRTAHVSRTRVLMERCFDGELAVVDDDETLDPGEWLYQFAYQTGAFVKVALNPAC